MLIRQMQEEDTAQVAAIEACCFSQPWSQKAFMDACKDENALFLVAEKEGEVSGYIGMYLSPPEGEITNVAVAEKARGQGLGQNLVRAMQQEGLKRGIDRIVLEVRVSNEPAIRTYEHTGFTGLGIRKNFYDFPREDASIMAWEKDR